MARAHNIYIVANASRSDEIFGLFTVKHEAISFMKRNNDFAKDWREGFCLLRSGDGQTYNPVDIDLTKID